MTLIKCKECGHEINKGAQACPNCGAKKTKSASGRSLFIIGLVILFLGYVSPSLRDTQSTKDESLEATPEEPKLLLLDWSWHEEGSYAIVEGLVKNISDASLEDVQAACEFYTEDKDFITSDTSLIEYNPLLPEQTSPFKIYAKFNPRMHSAKIDFKKHFGGSINWENQE